MTQTWAEMILELRVELLDMTQEQFAALIRVHPQTVSNWETGLSVPTSYAVRYRVREVRERLAGRKKRRTT